MRDLKLARSCVGLAVLAVLAPDARAQQAQRAVRPIEQLSIEPVTMEWSELLHIQATVPVMATRISGEPALTFELPIEELTLDGSKLLQHELPGGVQKLGPCAGFPSEPPIDAAFDSQLDVPDGMGFSFIPPDVAGGVGPAHLLTMLENQVLVTDRNGGNPVAVDTSVFWSPLGSTPASPTHVYPRVHFDDLSGRWLVSIRNGIGSLGTTVIFFAISQSDDPTGTWDYYAIDADPADASQADWIQLGCNDTWVVFTANMFNLAGTVSLGSKMWAVDKSTALAGGPLTVSTFPAGFLSAVHGSGGTSPMPARTLDSNPTLWMANNSFTSGGVFLLQLTRVTGTGAAPVVSGIPGSPFGGSTSFCFTSTNYSGTQRSMAQVGEARFISPFSPRLASVAVRNGMIWIANSGGLPGPATNAAPTSNGVVWHQVDPTLPFPGAPAAPGTMVLQSGAITNGVNTMSMYPSIAVNCADDVLIGFANGDATISPRACYSMRLGTDALNSMGPIQQLKAGESTYWKNFGVGTTAQYGRYTSTCVDPNDDKTLWTLQEYADMRVGPADNDSRWGTHWGRLGDCDELPLITDDPDSFFGCIGDPVTMMVVASSANPITYQWRKNGIDIPGETSDTLTFLATVAGDAGSYDVVICGCGQAISAVATISFAAPIVTTQPISQVVKTGDPASFFVAGTGTGTLTYQWYLNGNPILGATSDTYSIASVGAADYGHYTCIITDDCGPSTSDVAKLQAPVVNRKQLAEFSFHIFENPDSTTGCIGDPVTFEVVAYPQGVTYEWRKDGTPIVPAETGSTLTINPVGPGDAGSYDVVVTHGLKTKTSSAATLTVGDIPTITVPPSPANQTQPAGSTVIYSVTATGTGTLTYQWRKRPFAPFAAFADIPGATGSSLTLEDINSNDAGTYRVIVSNECGGVASTTARLTVN